MGGVLAPLRWVSVHGARVTAVQSVLGIGAATRQPLWPSGTQVDSPASMRTSRAWGTTFGTSLSPRRGHTRRADRMRRRETMKEASVNRVTWS